MLAPNSEGAADLSAGGAPAGVVEPKAPKRGLEGVAAPAFGVLPAAEGSKDCPEDPPKSPPEGAADVVAGALASLLPKRPPNDGAAEVAVAVPDVLEGVALAPAPKRFPEGVEPAPGVPVLPPPNKLPPAAGLDVMVPPNSPPELGVVDDC